jgi:hypothetical protein
MALERPEQLFVADPPLPSSPAYNRYTVEPALAVVRREAWRIRAHEDVVLDVALPASVLHDALADELTAAARRWMAVADEVDASEGEAATVLGRRTLLPALGLFVALTVVSLVVLAVARATDELVVRVIGQGLGVAAWVVLWTPVERLSRYRLDRGSRARGAQALARLTVEVHPA